MKAAPRRALCAPRAISTASATTLAQVDVPPVIALDQLFIDPHRLVELQWWAAALGYQGKAKFDLTF